MSTTIKIEGRCPHCHIGIGQFHRDTCPTEVCPLCGQFFATCTCSKEDADLAGRIAWSGYRPGMREAAALGMFITIHDIEVPDTNRFFASHQWDPIQRTYIKKTFNS